MSRPALLKPLALGAFVAAIAVAAPVLGATHHQPTGIYVGDLSPGDDGVAPYECGSKDNPCDSLEHAVTHASAGETLLLANGVLREGPVTIGKNLSIEGATGRVKSVLKPATDVEPGSAWFRVPAGVNVEWKMVTFEGAGHQVAEVIRYEGSGQVADSVFKKFSGGGRNTAVASLGGDVIVYKSEFSEIGRSAVLVSGAGQSSSVLGNRITGRGTKEEYGVEVEAGAHVAIRNNTITDYSGGSPEGPKSAAIAVRGAEPATEAEVTANVLRHSTEGLGVSAAGGPAVVKARANAFVGDGAGIAAHGATVDAGENWWGCNGGPGATGCDGFEGAVEAPTWLTLTVEAERATVPIAGTSTVTATVTRDSSGRQVPVPSLAPIEGLESDRPNDEGVGAVGFADGASVAFSASGGFLASPATTVAGSAASTFTAIAPPGTATVRASLDHAVAETSIAVVHPGGNAGQAPGSSPAGGTRGNDHLYGTPRADSIEAFAGNDLLVGGAGDDRLSGGQGDDVAYGGAGEDLLLGGVGNDILNGGPGNDLITGSAGADRLVGGRGRDVLSGGAGDDRLLAADGEGGDVLSCGRGNDVAVADAGDTVANDCERVVRRLRGRAGGGRAASQNQ